MPGDSAIPALAITVKIEYKDNLMGVNTAQQKKLAFKGSFKQLQEMLAEVVTKVERVNAEAAGQRELAISKKANKEGGA